MSSTSASRYRSKFFPLFVLVLMLGGCRSKTGGVAVHGNVAFRGTPLTKTVITFFPMSGRPIATSITDGEYSTELPPGDYVVQLAVGVDVPEGYKEGDPLPPLRYSLPPEYTSRAKSTLKATVKQQ